MECNKAFDDDFTMMMTTSQALLEVERRRRNNENGINRKIDRMMQEERLHKTITELSKEMIAWKRRWLDITFTIEQYKGD